MIRLIASDLDGTLIGEDSRLSDRTLAALRQAAQSGIEILFITGRPLRWLQPVLAQLGEDWPYQRTSLICSNGAITYSLARRAVESSRCLSGQQVLDIHQELERAFPQAIFLAETQDSIYAQGPYQPHNSQDASILLPGPLTQTLPADAQVVKYLLYQAGATPALLLEQAGQLVGERASVTRSAPYEPLVEIAQRGLSKGRILADFAAQRGIEPGQVLAFGDMPNDLEMLTWAGWGYVMASGLPELQARVGRVCPPLDQDGVAQIIERVLAGQHLEEPSA